MLTRWSGRPKIIATAISAGASSSTISSSVGLSVNRMMTEPTSPMTDDSRLVIVWVSIVRTSVTSLERRDTSSPTRLAAWKSSESVTSRPNRSPRSWATTRSPTTPRRYVCRKLPAAWTHEQGEQDDDQAIEPARIAAGHDLSGDAGDDQRERETDERRQHQADECDAEPARGSDGGSGGGGPRARRRSCVPRGRPLRRPSAGGRTAGSCRDDGTPRRGAAEAPRRAYPLKTSRRGRSRAGCRARCGSPAGTAATASGP